jgi:hypothetical protein
LPTCRTPGEVQENAIQLILEPDQVDSKTNEITAIPMFIKQMAIQGVVFAFDAISTQKKRMHTPSAGRSPTR